MAETSKAAPNTDTAKHAAPGKGGPSGEEPREAAGPGSERRRRALENIQIARDAGERAQAANRADVAELRNQEPHIHPSAQIDPKAKIDPEAIIGPGVKISGAVNVMGGAVIGEGAEIKGVNRIAGWTDIGKGAVIGERARIGEGCRLADGVVVGKDATLGYACHMGSGSTIGEKAICGGSVKIGRETTIDAKSAIGDKSQIGDLCYVGESVGAGRPLEMHGGPAGNGVIVENGSVIGNGRARNPEWSAERWTATKTESGGRTVDRAPAAGRNEQIQMTSGCVVRGFSRIESDATLRRADVWPWAHVPERQAVTGRFDPEGVAPSEPKTYQEVKEQLPQPQGVTEKLATKEAKRDAGDLKDEVSRQADEAKKKREHQYLDQWGEPRRRNITEFIHDKYEDINEFAKNQWKEAGRLYNKILGRPPGSESGDREKAAAAAVAAKDHKTRGGDVKQPESAKGQSREPGGPQRTTGSPRTTQKQNGRTTVPPGPANKAEPPPVRPAPARQASGAQQGRQATAGPSR